MKKAALGTKLIIGIGTNHVAELTSISGIDKSADTIDVTTLDSPNGYREFVQGLKDGGEVALSGFFDAEDTTGQIALDNAFESGEVTDFSIVFPAGLGAKWDFKGIVTGISTAAEMEDGITFESTIKVTGKPTLTVS